MSEQTSELPTTPVDARSLVLRVVAAVCLVASGLLVIPFQPWMPVAGLDASWCYAFNEAVARHMVFGRDLIFTFGPLASVYTTMYGPATDSIMLIGSAVVALGICATAWAIAWERHKELLIALPFLIAVCAFRDPLFMILPVLVLMAAWGRKNALAICIGAAAVGILPLIKGSLTALSAIEIALVCVLLAMQGRWRVAVATALLPCLAIVTAWILLGQPIGALGDYLRMQSPIIAGYTEAMASPGPLWAAIAYLIFGGVILLAFAAHLLRKPSIQNLIVLAGLALFVAVNFKAGFVRQDVHPLISAAALLFLAFCICSSVSGRLFIAVAILGIAGWSLIEASIPQETIAGIHGRVHNTVVGRIQGIKMRLTSPGALKDGFEQAKLSIKNQSPLPAASGSADVYPTDISILLAHDMDWSPRPILQSYSAYTPVLDNLNARHLEGSKAPQNIYLSVGPIDNRMATTEDAHSWPILLTRYVVAKDLGDQLWLTRTTGGSYTLGKETTVSASLDVEKPFPVPIDGPVWASIDIRKTGVGKLLSAAYKMPSISIEMKLSDGSTVEKRIVPEMVSGGFILSPYIGTMQDFVAARNGQGRRVVAVRLLSPSHHGWASAFTMTFRPLTLHLD